MKQKTGYTLSGVFAALFLLLILAVKTIDVAAIGPEGTKIGLSHVNAAVHTLFGFNPVWYKITQALGLLAIGVAAVFALIGLVQLVQRRSFWKVDRELGALGVLYAVVVVLYALFEVVIVNYRPVIMPDAAHVEASFPSSHTMLICVVMGSAMMLAARHWNGRRDGSRRATVDAVCALVMALTVFGRLISGVHWFTDILGGVLLSAALLSLYAGFLGKPGKRREAGK